MINHLFNLLHESNISTYLIFKQCRFSSKLFQFKYFITHPKFLDFHVNIEIHYLLHPNPNQPILSSFNHISLEMTIYMPATKTITNAISSEYSLLQRHFRGRKEDTFLRE